MSFQNQDQSSSSSQKRVCLGKIAGTHGVKGLVKILGFGDDPALIFEITPLYTKATGDETISLTYKNPSGKFYLASIDGITNKEDAEALNKPELWVERSALPDLSNDDEYYVEDLIGLRVVDENNAPLGKIKAVPNFGAGELLEIKPASGQSFLLPFTNENAPSVDLNSGIITVRNCDMYKMED